MNDLLVEQIHALRAAHMDACGGDRQRIFADWLAHQEQSRREGYVFQSAPQVSLSEIQKNALRPNP